MMLQFSGVCILCVVVFLWGNNHVNVMQKKIGFFEAMSELIRYTSVRIDYLLMPLDEIFTSFHNEYFERTGFSLAMKQKGLREAIQANKELDDPEKQFFLGFLSTLGSNCREEEVKLCHYYLDELTIKLTQLKEEFPGKAKLWRSLPLLGLLSLFLFLL